jgi:hypothetical protein
MDAGTAAVELVTSCTTFFLPSLQVLARPVIEIDAEPRYGVWGCNSFVVAPGEHTLTAYHRWGVIRRAYASSTAVVVPEGQSVRLQWHTGWFVWSPGKWTVE